MHSAVMPAGDGLPELRLKLAAAKTSSLDARALEARIEMLDSLSTAPEPEAAPSSQSQDLAAPIPSASSAFDDTDERLFEDARKQIGGEVVLTVEAGAIRDVVVEVESADELITWQFTEAAEAELAVGVLFEPAGPLKDPPTSAAADSDMLVGPVQPIPIQSLARCRAGQGTFEFGKWSIGPSSPPVLKGSLAAGPPRFPARLLLRFDNSATWFFPRTILLSLSKPPVAEARSDSHGGGSSGSPALGETSGESDGSAPQSGKSTTPTSGGSDWEALHNCHITVTPVLHWHELGDPRQVPPGELGKNDEVGPYLLGPSLGSGQYGTVRRATVRKRGSTALKHHLVLL
eukprot:SAG31_NODE_41_length_31342_cov_8.029286_15_plen_346_part_00